MTAERPQDEPLFDDVRKALTFAFNAAHVDMPRPFMNKAMAEAPAKKMSKMKLKALTDAGLAPEAPVKHINLMASPRLPTGVDKAAQAGLILQLVGRLDPAHQNVLAGLLIVPSDPCYCQSWCCSGRMPNQRWLKASRHLVEHLRDQAEVTKVPGKKGLSTQPDLRIALTELYLTGADHRIGALAAKFQVSTITVATHKAWIFEYLEALERDAWLQIQAIFDQEGVTGSFA